MGYAKFAVAAAIAGWAGSAAAYDADDWPTHYTFSDGTDIGLTMVYRYDLNDFSDDRLPNGSHQFEDSSTNRIGSGHVLAGSTDSPALSSD